KSMFHLTFAQVVQVRSPMSVVCQVVSHVVGQKNVTGVTAIHYSLGDVNSRACDVDTLVHVGDPVDRPAMDSHSDMDLRKNFERICDFERASNRFLGTPKE